MRLSILPLSIRWRLTLWITLVLAAVLVGFAGLVYGLSARALYEQTDQRLLAGLERLERDERLLSDATARLRYWAYEFYEHENLFLIVHDAAGKVQERTQELPQDAVPAAPATRAGARRFGSAAVPVLGRQRLLTSGLSVADRTFGIVLMTSLAEVDRELSHLLSVLTMTIPVALAVSGVLAYFLARKALAPMEQLRRSTQNITADRLDRRLPVLNRHDELGGLALTINDMIGRLERSFTEIRRFTADASHELRTPLTAIRTEAEVALSKPTATPEQRQLLGSILEECERLTRLTDQLLTLSREDAGVAVAGPQALDLAALTTDVVDNMRPLAEAKGVELTTRLVGAVSVRGDPARLRQVLYNLLDNAVKYTPANGRVEVTAEARGSSAVLSVADTGEGIAPEHVPHIFERFYRVDKARTRAQGGTGLGLSIARSIVTAHGGKIDVVSAPGQGAVFSVVLPLDAERDGTTQTS
jgi:two-component system, OmpR family, heavy metal sensor histidine kinase CusS